MENSIYYDFQCHTLRELLKARDALMVLWDLNLTEGMEKLIEDVTAEIERRQDVSEI